jgi:hypothetical protein
MSPMNTDKKFKFKTTQSFIRAIRAISGQILLCFWNGFVQNENFSMIRVSRAINSAARVPRLHRGRRGFESLIAHRSICTAPPCVDVNHQRGKKIQCDAMTLSASSPAPKEFEPQRRGENGRDLTTDHTD